MQVSGGAIVSTTIQFAVPIEKIAEFCQQWRIQEFSLFGSILNERFRDESDVDVLVLFAPDVIYTFAQLDDMQEELEVIFARSVDLIDKVAIQESPNYLRRRDILGSAQVIYLE
jgi:predicted nucleotidyltransferase